MLDLGYETKKIVRIRDNRLGIIYIALTALIGAYVVFFQILYNNEHFRKKDVYGTARVTIQQPTKGACNPNKKGCKSDFHALTELEYCEVYKGNATNIALNHRHKCIFADQHTLAPEGMLDGEMLVPTRIDRIEEHKHCFPSAANGYTCDNEYELAEDPKIVYVADIERYTIMVAHTYKRGILQGNNQWIQGYLMECVEDDEGSETKKAMQTMKEYMQGERQCNGEYKRKPIECITGTCAWHKEEKKGGSSFMQARRDSRSQEHSRAPKKRGLQTALLSSHEQEAAAEGVNPAELAAGGYFAIPDGDIFRIDKLLELTHLTLDGSFNLEGEPLRESGTVIEIEAVYSNLRPWTSSFGDTEVSYEYKVSRRPMEEMKTEMLSANNPEYPSVRFIDNRHGLFIVVKISGEFGFFSVVDLGLMLATAMALTAVATTMTDMLMTHVMPHHKEYYKCKYEVTDRLHEKLSD